MKAIAGYMKRARMIDLKTVNPKEWVGWSAYEAILNNNLRAKIDDKTGNGVVYIRGLGDLKFSAGGENLYIELPKELMVKDMKDKFLKALLLLGQYTDVVVD